MSHHLFFGEFYSLLFNYILHHAGIKVNIFFLYPNIFVDFNSTLM
nr:MAG TPA: hypothetical protein [Caudoviricetes sp.]